MFPLSVLVSSTERCLQRPFSVAGPCEPGSASSRPVTLSAPPSCSGPRLKNAKGAAEKSGSAYLSGLMSKMLQSSGNLLQSGTHSLLLQRSLQRAEEREMKGMKNGCGY